jgi:hypothetical protein
MTLPFQAVILPRAGGISFDKTGYLHYLLRVGMSSGWRICRGTVLIFVSAVI